MQYFKFGNTYEIPAVGCGTNTFGKAEGKYDGEINFDTTEIESAIKIGYRHFDTAISYRNEEVLALGIEKSGLQRQDFFLVTKIPGKPEYIRDTEAIQASVESSLAKLKTDYLDLYLIHHPWDVKKEMTRTWRVLEAYHGLGVLRSIGVSNYTEKHLAHLLKKAEIKPVVNQIESHPGNWNHHLIAYCQDNGIIPVAWSPLKNTREVKKELKDICAKYNKTPAQVILRYQVDRGVVVIPKSHSPEHQEENFDIFNFTLTEKERQQIGKL